MHEPKQCAPMQDMKGAGLVRVDSSSQLLPGFGHPCMVFGLLQPAATDNTVSASVHSTCELIMLLLNVLHVAGCSATVWRARCVTNDRIVAVKILNLEAQMAPLEDIVHEAQTMKVRRRLHNAAPLL